MTEQEMIDDFVKGMREANPDLDEAQITQAKVEFVTAHNAIAKHLNALFTEMDDLNVPVVGGLGLLIARVLEAADKVMKPEVIHELIKGYTPKEQK